MLFDTLQGSTRKLRFDIDSAVDVIEVRKASHGLQLVQPYSSAAVLLNAPKHNIFPGTCSAEKHSS